MKRTGLRAPLIREDAGAAIAIALGAVLFRQALVSDAYQRYVRRSSRDYLVAAGAVLVALGVIGVIRAHTDRGRRNAGRSGDHGVPRAALLLLAPMVAVFCVAPPALGTYAASRVQTAVLRSHLTAATELPPETAGAVTLTVSDFIGRVDVGQNLTVGRYRLTGFVMPDPKAQNGEVNLTRLQIVCCAADAQTTQVPVAGIRDTPKEGTWITVIGSETVVNGYPELQAISMQRTNSPTDPYE